MNRTLLFGFGILGFCSALLSEAGAHGGLYRGPGPTIPPPFAPGTGSPGGPTTPGHSGTPVSGPATSGGGVARTVARKRVGKDYTGWATWWEMNKHPYLNLRARLGSRFSVTGLGRDGLGENRFDDSATSVRPDFEELKTRMLPVLRKLLKEDDPDIVDSAVLALARVTPSAQADLVIEDLKGALQHTDRSVQQAAILGLGVLGERQAVPLL
ncbi:MAG: HEAT repeat domain-containing protein, partial [Planctomycetota bacterium]